MKIEKVPIQTLFEDAANTRKHNERNIQAIAASLLRFGQQKPIVARAKDRTVIAGNGTLVAARSLGWQTINAVFTHLEGSEAIAYSIADNRTAELAEWSHNDLSQILNELDQELRTAAGFTDEEIQSMLQGLDSDQSFEDDSEPIQTPEESVTKPGDLWILGDHRLLCGDAMNAEDVALVLSGQKPRLMITDPPYGVSYSPEWRDSIRTANTRVASIESDQGVRWLKAFQLSPAHVIYCWSPQGRDSFKMFQDIEGASFIVRSQIIWVKQMFSLSRGHYHYRHEPCWYAVKDGETAQWIGDRKQSSVWEINRDLGYFKQENDTPHSTQKPLECMLRPMRNHEGDVYDPFVGSGTTIIAAQKLKRRCFAMDILPAYVDVCIMRWERETEADAILAPTSSDPMAGRTFAEVAESRSE